MSRAPWIVYCDAVRHSVEGFGDRERKNQLRVLRESGCSGCRSEAPIPCSPIDAELEAGMLIAPPVSDALTEQEAAEIAADNAAAAYDAAGTYDNLRAPASDSDRLSGEPATVEANRAMDRLRGGAPRPAGA